MTSRNPPGERRDATQRLLLRNTAILAIPRAAAYPVAYVALAYSARKLQPQAFGSVQFALAVVQYFGIAAALGLPILGAREVARDPHRGAGWVPLVVGLRLALGVCAYAALLGLALLGPFTADTRTALVIIGALLVATAFNLDWYYQGTESMAALSAAGVLGSLVGSLPVFVLVHDPGDLAAAAWIVLAAAVVPYAMLLALRPRLFRHTHLPISLRAALRPALPLGLSATITTVYYNLDTIMIGALLRPPELGYYGAAYRVIFALLWLSTALTTSLLPILSRLYASDRAALIALVARIGRSAAVLGIPCAVLVTFNAAALVSFAFGARYAPAATPLALLTWSFLIFLVGVAYGWALVAVGDGRGWLTGVALGFAVNLAANVVLIPTVGIDGAAAATVAAELVIVAWMFRRFRRIGSIGVTGTIVRTVAAAIAMSALLIALHATPAYLASLAGLVVYGATAAILGSLRRPRSSSACRTSLRGDDYPDR